MKQENIFLTGGSGFIGMNILSSYLFKKYNIISPTHSELELLEDKKVEDFFKKNKIHTVIHSAIKPGHRYAKDASNQLYNNTRMFFNIVRNADRFKKMIFISSGLVYDMRYYIPKIKEEYFNKHIPVDEAGFSKYISAKYIEKSDKIIELRLFGIFGKYEDYSFRFISNAICKTLFDLPITIKQNRKFDYIYIDDLMLVIDYFIENRGSYKSYNVTPDEAIELYSLAEKVRRISEKDLPIIVKESGLGPEYSGDNTRLKKELKQTKFMPIDEAIKKLYNWYSNNKKLINRELLLFDK